MVKHPRNISKSKVKQLKTNFKMENSKNWFKYQIKFLKFVSMQPLDFEFLPPKVRFLKKIFNFLIGLFWHLIIIHIVAFQMQTILMNLDKSLDEYIDYVMIGSIYIYGYSLICFWQFNAKKLLSLFDFIHKNFRERSAKGENDFWTFEMFEKLHVAYTFRHNFCQLWWNYQTCKEVLRRLGCCLFDWNIVLGCLPACSMYIL